jgi:hypothetical protein
MDSWSFLSFPRQVDFCGCGSGRGEEPGGAKGPAPDSDPFTNVDHGKNQASLSIQFAIGLRGAFECNERSQLFIGAHDVTVRVAAMWLPTPAHPDAEINTKCLCSKIKATPEVQSFFWR